MSASVLERKLWKIENIINMMNKIVLDLHITASEAGNQGRGVGAIANEARKFMMIFEKDVFSQLKFEDKAIEDVEHIMEEMGSMLRLLGINSILEARRVNNMKAYILCDELRKIGESIQNVLEPNQYKKNLNMTRPDMTFKEPLPYIVANIGGAYWAEGMQSIFEVIKVKEEMLKPFPEGPGKMKHKIKISGGTEIPVINIHHEMGEEVRITDESRIIIMNLGHIMYGHTSSDLFFGLLVDEIEYTGFLRKGIHELDIPSNAPAHFVRHVWKTVDDTSLLFFNWDNIINEHEIRDSKRIENKQ